MPFVRRGRLLDHTLAVCEALWTQRRSGYHSPELSLDNIHQMPKPTQVGGVPVWVSGTVNDAVARGVSRFVGPDTGPAVKDPAGRSQRRRTNCRPRQRPDRITDSRPRGNRPCGRTGSIDIATPVASAPPLISAGVTDVRITLSLPRHVSHATDLLTELGEAFRVATR